MARWQTWESTRQRTKARSMERACHVSQMGDFWRAHGEEPTILLWDMATQRILDLS